MKSSMVLQAQIFFFVFLLFFFISAFPRLAHAVDVKGRVIDDQGKGIAQAAVFVQTPPSREATASSARKATLDQIDKQFVPNLLVVPTGTEVQFPNRDQIHHHVYSLSRTKSFNVPLYKGEDVPSVSFDQAGVVNVGCNIHDWMSASILVVPTPYYTTTDETGGFTLSGLLPGTYSIVSWHERSRTKVPDTAQQVRVEDNTPALTFTLTLKPAQDRPATSGQRGYR